ncbi:MAG: hypothetical protein AB7S68_20115 [Polyangiaceae bacterium]
MSTLPNENTASSPRRRRPLGRFLRMGLGGLALIGLGSASTAGCLDRPVSPLNPNTSNLFVDQITQTAVDKIDLLFMIDNSASMADKQAVLRDAVPDLVNRLVNPFCVDGAGALAPTQPTAPDADCPSGFEREFRPIKDFHLGVISSSLGDAGAGSVSGCAANTPPEDDQGRLMGTVRSGLAGDNGFLTWGGTGDSGQLINDFQSHVSAAGESGCGYEASLEAWYRFLVDPDPPASLQRQPCNANDANNSCVGKVGTDDALIAQRTEFLRPDSLLAVIMLTDENDCSIQQGGQFWFAADVDAFGYRPTKTCESDPNSSCCYSCAQGQKDGCPAKADECTGAPLGGDSPNLRCWDQKRRSGIDFLYPIDRYVEALSKIQVTVGYNGCDPVKKDNPLYKDLKSEGRPTRDASLVFFAGIVGVPWQDLAATQETCDALGEDACPNADGSLKYLTAPQLTALNRWESILGTPVAGGDSGCEAQDVTVRHQFRNPTDPFMIETAFPRSGTNTFANATLPGDNGLNGRDYDTSNASGEATDLEYACIFDLTENPCDSGACDCESQRDIDSGKPLCTGVGQQNKAKAYPGTRLLSALQGYGDNSIIASICPKTLAGGAVDYGYRPAVTAIIDRLKEALNEKCLPRKLQPDSENPDPNLAAQVPCKIIESVPPEQVANLSCSRAGRADADPAVIKAVKAELTRTGVCGKDTGRSCDEYLYCEILQLTGGELTQCLNEVAPAVTGWCYVDEAQGNPDLIARCPASQRQVLRFFGDQAETPARGATTFIACKGASLEDTSVTALK